MDDPIKIQGRQHCATALYPVLLFSYFIANEGILLAIKVSGRFPWIRTGYSENEK